MAQQTPVTWLQERLIESGVNLLSGEVEFIQQAKQMEKEQRMYSEEEVLNILFKHTIELFKENPCTFVEFFEQFKKQ